MNNKLLITFAAIALIAASCTKENVNVETRPTITVTVGVPANDAATRTILSMDPGTNGIIVRWKPLDEAIDLYFKQGTTIKELKNVSIQNISADGKTGTFTFTLPDGITATDPYTLYGVHGTASKIDGNKINVDVSLRLGFLLAAFNVPMAFEAAVTGGAVPAVQFKHLGAMSVVHLTNNTDAQLMVAQCLMTESTTDPLGSAYMLNNSESSYAAYDLIGKKPGLSTFDTGAALGVPNYINAGKTNLVPGWFRPSGIEVLETYLYYVFNVYSDSPIVNWSTNSRPARAALEIGKSYHVYATWDGTNVTLTDPPTP